MRHTTKSALTILAGCAVCLSFCSCGTVDKPLTDFSTPDIAAAESSTPDIADSASALPETDSHLTSSVSFLQTKMNDYYNAVQEFKDAGAHIDMTTMFLALSEANAPDKEIDLENIPADGSSLHLTLNAIIGDPEADAPADYETVMLLTVNGQLCDFSLDGKSSTCGLYQTVLSTNSDLVASLEATDLPVREGENEFAFYTFQYNAELDKYLTAQSVSGWFTSDEANAGKSIAAASEDVIGNISAVTAADKMTEDEIYTTKIVSDEDYISSDAESIGIDSLTVKPTPTLHYYIFNTDDSANRSGILLFFDNGKLQPVWNGNTFGSVSVSDKELRKDIALKTDYKAGENHHTNWFYLETQNDKSEVFPEETESILQISE